MTVAAPYLYALAFAVGYGAGWQTNEWRHDSNEAATRVETVTKVVERVIVDRAETEKIRGQYLEFKKNAYEEITRYKSRVAELGGLHVNAECMPAAGTDASGASTGTARLNAKAEEDYFSYEREYAEQLQLFRMCRSELIKRSSK